MGDIVVCGGWKEVNGQITAVEMFAVVASLNLMLSHTFPFIQNSHIY